MRHVALGALVIVSTAHADPPNVAKLADIPTETRGLDALPAWPTVVATPSVVSIAGKAVAPVDKGEVDAGDKSRITQYVTAYRAVFNEGTRPPLAGFSIVVDKTLSYRLLFELLSAVKAGGIQRFKLVGKSGETAGSIPIVVPDVPFTPPANTPEPVELVLSATKDKLVLWSMSGTEGTLRTPKLVTKRTELPKITEALVEIAKRRYRTTKRSDADRQIILMADGSLTMQDIFDDLVAIRTTSDGKDLFPDVLLASGLE